mmetsp:Transcript_17799/g.24043  ORF Transcript_17799/g.24043 Transcript_17799/m.24043 type:complete len:142 (-) Transcript_17799:203-628(-)
MLLLLLPQAINFVYSLPQLLKLVPCPRHRMPVLDPKTGQVTNSYFEVTQSGLSTGGRAVVGFLRATRLAKFTTEKAAAAAGEGVEVTKISNLTLVNLVLYFLGPCREDELCTRLLAFQGLCAVLAFIIRFFLAGFFFDVVR